MPVSPGSEAGRQLSALGVAARRANAQRRRIEKAVAAVIDLAPELTDEQAARLRSIFGGAR